MQWMRSCAAVGAIVALAAFSTACGDDEESGGGSASSGTDKTPSGEPIVLYDISDTSGAGSISAVLKQFPDAAQAAVDHVNKDLGGLDGRPFKLVKCDSKADPAATTACANQAVQDKALAKVGLSVLWDNGNKVFAKEGIVSHNAPVTASDSVSPTSFPFGGGAASEWPGEVQYWGTEMGAKHGVTLADDNAQGQVNVDLMQAQAAKIPGFKLDVVRLKIGADPTPSVARVVGLKPDVVFTAAAGSAAVAVYPRVPAAGLLAGEDRQHRRDGRPGDVLQQGRPGRGRGLLLLVRVRDLRRHVERGGQGVPRRDEEVLRRRRQEPVLPVGLRRRDDRLQHRQEDRWRQAQPEVLPRLLQEHRG